MTSLEQIQVVQFFLLVGLLLFGCSYMYKRTRCDRFREDLFTIRDMLFDYMWQHKVPYDLPAYQLMRDCLNGMIRGANLIQFSIMLIFLLLTRGRHKPSALRIAIDRIEDGKTRVHFQMVYQQMGRRLFEYLFLEGLQWILGKPVELYLKHRKRKSSQEQTRLNTIDLPLARELRDELVSEFIVFGRPKSPEARCLARVASGRIR